MKKTKLLGVQFDAVTLEDALGVIRKWFDRKHEQFQIVTPNPEILLASRNSDEYRSALNKASLSIPDGIGILWASSFLHATRQTKSKLAILFKAFVSLLILPFSKKSARQILPERVTGVDLMTSICGWCSKNDIPVFLLGAENGIAQKTSQKLQDVFHNLHVAGTYSGSPEDADFPLIKGYIERSQARVLFVAYGAPAQELWIAKHLKKLQNIKVAMGVGGAFDFISGKTKRAPRIMQKLGLEWLYRLFKEPRRMKRIFNATIRFPIVIMASRLKKN